MMDAVGERQAGMNWLSSTLLKPLAQPNVKNETTSEKISAMIGFPMKAIQSFEIAPSPNTALKAPINNNKTSIKIAI
jgi:hypothetical protein